MLRFHTMPDITGVHDYAARRNESMEQYERHPVRCLHSLPFEVQAPIPIPVLRASEQPTSFTGALGVSGAEVNL